MPITADPTQARTATPVDLGAIFVSASFWSCDDQDAFCEHASDGLGAGQSLNVMLLTHSKWSGFTNRPIPPTTSSEVMLAISYEGRDSVDQMNEAAASHGGKADINPAQAWVPVQSQF
ncbi:VOC family protein [Rhizobium hidalgonense]|uniref:VOC family protein n=1 Tax=Rhizobium hidalgonense TaxID=1538159 RepID=UPI001FE089B0|nr:hypothetical protein [Rhizobium hidalgonense]